MGVVIFVSLPLLLFAIGLGFGCYQCGKTKGRQEAYAGANAQVLGMGTASGPPGVAAKTHVVGMGSSSAPPPGIVVAGGGGRGPFSPSPPPPPQMPHYSGNV